MQSPDKAMAAPAQSGNGHQCSLRDSENNQTIAQIHDVAQARIELSEVERELLREEVFDCSAEAINYLGAIRAFLASDDLPGLKYSYSKFAAHGRVVASGCKRLIASGAEARP
jgi:hypothetical protein